MKEILWGVLIIIIATIIMGILKWGRDKLRKFWYFMARHRPRVSRETVKVLPQMRGSWWKT